MATLLLREDKELRRELRGEYQEKLGVVLNALERDAGKLDPQRDEFMTGFWSGYMLQDLDRPRKPAEATNETVTPS